MRALVPILLFVFAVGCTRDDDAAPAEPVPAQAPRGAATEVLRADAEAPPADPALPERVRETYGDHAGADEALAYAETFRAARTDADFRAAYDRALALEAPDFGDDFGDDFDGLGTFTDGLLGLPGVVGSCAGECTVAVYALDVAAWQAAAQRTGASQAAAFFEALEAAWGEQPRVHEGDFAGFPTTFAQTWDYGGYSTLGAGRYTAALDAVDRALGDGSTPFRAPLRALRAALLDEAAGTACIGGTPADARREVARLRQRSGLTEPQRAALDRQHDALGAPSRSGIETGCADFKAGGCSCASG